MPKNSEQSANDIALKSKKYQDISTIMKDPGLRAKLTNLVDEAVTCKGAIALQQQNIKVLRDVAIEELQLNPKLFNAYVAAAYNNDYNQRKDSLDEQLSLLEFIMGETGTLTDRSDD